MIKISFFIALFLFVFAAAFTSAQSYNYTDAVDAVYYSKIAYCTAKHIENWQCTACPKFPGMTNVTIAQVEDDASTGWVGFDAPKNRIVLAFRGTVDLQGWIEDGDFFKTLYDPSLGCGPDCNVHQGLYWGTTLMLKTLLPALLQLVAVNPTANILITGHSMGAGQSELAYPIVAAKVAGLTKGSVHMINFGSPRVGTVNFVKWRQTVNHEHTWRCTNYGDPVVHLPPLIFDDLNLGRWIHNPREVFYKDAFGSPSAFKICDGNYTTEDPTCADSTPIFQMSFQYHTTYLGIGMGCFL